MKRKEVPHFWRSKNQVNPHQRCGRAGQVSPGIPSPLSRSGQGPERRRHPRPRPVDRPRPARTIGHLRFPRDATGRALPPPPGKPRRIPDRSPHRPRSGESGPMDHRWSNPALPRPPSPRRHRRPHPHQGARRPRNPIFRARCPCSLSASAGRPRPGD